MLCGNNDSEIDKWFYLLEGGLSQSVIVPHDRDQQPGDRANDLLGLEQRGSVTPTAA
jgi:hypothetical protein